MRIAQVSPLFESVPPKYYGGTERVVSWLTEELVRLGHDVTLYASGDSVTSARLVAGSPASLRLNEKSVDHLAHHLVMLERLKRDAGRYDIIHYHCDYMHFPFSRQIPTPHVTTLHGRLDIPDLAPLYGEYSEMPVISISNAQRRPLPDLAWKGTVYHGLPPHMYELNEKPQPYLAFLGRVSYEKRLDRAIEIATRTGMPLKIAAKVDKPDAAYFEETIEPMLARPGIEWLGEVGEADKQEFLGNAVALLFPIDWPEPFGLVMIEAMACGTPVIAFEAGSVPEVIDDGVTGFVVGDMDSAVAAVRRVGSLDRRTCRRVFEERFVVEKMACSYAGIYESLIHPGRAAPRTPTGTAAAPPFSRLAMI